MFELLQVIDVEVIDIRAADRGADLGYLIKIQCIAALILVNFSRGRRG